MERTGSRMAPGSAPDGTRADAPAFRDAAAILARSAADEEAADRARELYRTQRVAALEPDTGIAPLLCTDEAVLAVRHSAMCDFESGPGGRSRGAAGDLYLTTRRLVLRSCPALSFELRDIDEVGVSGERLLLVMRDGTAVSLDVAQPRLLRVEIGNARALARG